MGNKKTSRVVQAALSLAAGAALACNLMAQLSATPPPATAAPALPPTAPAATAAPEATLAPTAINHVMRPDSPGGAEGYITDTNSQKTGAQGRAPGGESYQINRFERPFAAQSMQYLGHLDVGRAEIDRSGAWFYVTLFLQGVPPAEAIGQAAYGVEVDTDLDGRGDALVWALAPGTGEWTTDGVQVWQDVNKDVGGPTPLASEPGRGGTGYETLLFNGGVGTDPDMAWVRMAPGNAAAVQIAFKSTALNGDPSFLWGVWTDGGVRQPGWFDYNDHFSSDQAGSPLVELKAQYPLKELFALDNTCRLAYGFVPYGGEPGMCEIPGTPVPTPTETFI